MGKMQSIVGIFREVTADEVLEGVIAMRLVILETPYAGDIAENIAFARACLRDCLKRGEAPIASHLLHTQVLDDMQPDERQLGIKAGHAWIPRADAVIVYVDKGTSQGMQAGIAAATKACVPVEYRRLEVAL